MQCLVVMQPFCSLKAETHTLKIQVCTTFEHCPRHVGLLKDLRCSEKRVGSPDLNVTLQVPQAIGGAVDVGVLPQCRQRGSCRFSPGKG